ncbi:MAG: hypothetical protein HZA52_18550 [Planctomycetes bacterium]|nr:hypothetical protein [Planctomycetota bacterium]
MLKRMAGPRERCMYCLDSHATDIEHFWPKAPYPERMFVWLNLLLSCAECGRFKGERFPLDGRAPLLVDPTVEDPWQFLDFEPRTGIVMARYDDVAGQQEPKGVATVDLLQLNQREALSHGYLRTYSRLRAAVEGSLTTGVLDASRLLHGLRAADDHGLLGWCFSERGAQEAPFKDLRARHRQVWDHCVNEIARG